MLETLIDKFFSSEMLENVFGNVVANWIVAAIGLASTVLIGRMALTIFRQWWVFATIRLTDGGSNAVRIVICEFSGDEHDAAGKLIRANLERNYRDGAGVAEKKVLSIVHFPLRLGSGPSPRAKTRASKIARKWMRRLEGDVIVWGESVDGKKLSLIRILGKSAARPLIPTPLEIELTVLPGQFNDHMADAITQEIAAASSNAYSSPLTASTATLRRISQKSASIVESELEGFSGESKDRIRRHFDDLQLELSRRAEGIIDWNRAISNARLRLDALREDDDHFVWAEAAYRFVTQVRRRAWAGLDGEKIAEAIEIASRAKSLFQRLSLEKQAVECAIQIAFLRYYKRRDLAGEVDQIEAEVDLLDAASISNKLAAIAVILTAEVPDGHEINLHFNQGLNFLWDSLDLDKQEPCFQFDFYSDLLLNSIALSVVEREDCLEIFNFSRRIATKHHGARNLASQAIRLRHADTCVQLIQLQQYFDEGPLIEVRLLLDDIEYFCDISETEDFAAVPWLTSELYFMAGASKFELGFWLQKETLAREGEIFFDKAAEISNGPYPKKNMEIRGHFCAHLNNYADYFNHRAAAEKAIKVIDGVTAGYRSDYANAYAHWVLADLQLRDEKNPPQQAEQFQSLSLMLDKSLRLCHKANTPDTPKIQMQLLFNLEEKIQRTRQMVSHH